MGHVAVAVAPAGLHELHLGVDALQRFGHEAGEGVVDGRHAEFVHAVDDLVLEGDGLVVEGLREVAVQLRHVTHAEPGQVGAAGHEVADLLVGHAHLLPYAGEDGLAADGRKGHVESVQGHPVQLALPVLPFPVGHGVAERADIHVVTVLERRNDQLQCLIVQLLRKSDVVDRPGGYAVVVGTHVVVEAAADGHRVLPQTVRRPSRTSVEK